MIESSTTYLYQELTHQIIGAAMTVHRFFGCGFSEHVYQDALELEFKNAGMKYQREHPIFAEYRGIQLKSEFKPDFICDDKVIVELKAVKELEDIHRSQAINYAKVAGYKLALLINFGEPSLKFERYIVNKNL